MVYDGVDILRLHLKINIFHVFNVSSLRNQPFQVVSLMSMDTIFKHRSTSPK